MITTRHYKPVLPPKATVQERDCADRWIRVTGRKECRTWLVVGNQYFDFGRGFEFTLEEAHWHCWMMAKALLKIERRAEGVVRAEINAITVKAARSQRDTAKFLSGLRKFEDASRKVRIHCK